MTANNQHKAKSAIFLDRDGTICEEVNYLSRPEDLRLIPGSGEGIKLLQDLGFLIIILTNQSGIGRGFFDIETLAKIHEKLTNELREKAVKLDAIYFCPHISNDNCDCRKPKSGMIRKAAEEFDIALASSWMIGDKPADIDCGRVAGTQTALVLTGYGKSTAVSCTTKPDIIGENLLVVAREICESC